MTPDAVRLEFGDALAEVYAGADLNDVDALLDQMTDRGLVLAEQTHADCSSRPEYEAMRFAFHDAANRCEEVVVERDAALAEITRLREALEGLAEHDRIAAGVLAALADRSDVHLLDREPPDQRVAVCGAVEESRQGERLNFTVDDAYISCRACAEVAEHLSTGGAEPNE